MSAIKTPMGLLEMALKKEEAAQRLYDRLLKEPQAGVVRGFLEQLREEETKHVRMVQRKIVDLRLGKAR